MPRTVCLCQPIFSMISSSVAPFLRWSVATTWAVLLPSRGPAPSSALAAFFGLGRALGGLCAALGLLVGLRLRGLGLGLGGIPKALDALPDAAGARLRSEEHTSELQSP